MSIQTKSSLSKESGVLLWKQRGQLGHCLWLASLSWAQLSLGQGANGFPWSTSRVDGKRDAELGEGGQWGACMRCQHLELHLARDIWEMSDKTGVFAHDFPFLADFKLLLRAESPQSCLTLWPYGPWPASLVCPWVLLGGAQSPGIFPRGSPGKEHGYRCLGRMPLAYPVMERTRSGQGVMIPAPALLPAVDPDTDLLCSMCPAVSHSSLSTTGKEDLLYTASEISSFPLSIPCSLETVAALY